MEDIKKLSKPEKVIELPPAYPILKMGTVEKVREAETCLLNELAREFDQYGAKFNGEVMRHSLIDMVLNARSGKYWAAGSKEEDKITIGYYCSEAIFYGTLFHELGHKFIQRIGYQMKLSSCRQDNWLEDFCWDFSRKACQLLDLPYDEKIGDFYRNFYQRVNLMDYEELVESERRVTGLSTLAQDPFYFTPEGVPVLGEPLVVRL